MSTLQEIEAGIMKLKPADIARLQVWLREYCEDHLKLTDEVDAALDQARREIEAGNYRTRQTA